MISIEEIKSLREETGLSIAQCRQALEAANGDRHRAAALLKEKGAEIVAKKSARALGAGAIVSYIHSGETVGVMLELLCETDFVAKNSEFKSVGHDIAMHIAAMNPGDTPELLKQPFIKNGEQNVGDLINNAVQKFGERIEMGRFVRFSVK